VIKLVATDRSKEGTIGLLLEAELLRQLAAKMLLDPVAAVRGMLLL